MHRLLSFLCVFIPVFSSVACAIPVAKLRRVRPVTLVRPRKNAAFINARERHPLNFGSLVRTERNGKAFVLFSNGTRLLLRGDSQMEIASPESPTQPLIVRLMGAVSEAYVRPQGNTKIVTSAGVAAARGTEFLVRLLDENTTQVIVAEGEVEFSNPFGSVLVKADQQSTARVGEAPKPPTAINASGEIQWTADISALPVTFELPAPPPGNSEFEALIARSESTRNSGDAPSALAAAQQALQAATDAAARTRARLSLAMAHLSADDEAGARAALEGETGALPLALLALTDLREGNANDALRNAEAARQADPNAYQARAMLSLSLLQANRVSEAITEGRRAAQLAPRSSLAQSAFALALFFSSNDKERRAALRTANLAAQLNPDAPLALMVQGRALLQRGRADEARSAYEQAHAFAPELPLLSVELGQAYLQLDWLPRAEKAFRRAVDRNPNDATAYAGLGIALARSGNAQAAIESFKTALKLSPRNTLARAGFARVLIEQGQLKEAEALLSEGLADGPEAGLEYVYLSEALLFRQKLVEAGDYARRAVALLPDSAIARYQLGRVYLEQERIGQAAEQFRQAVTLDPLFAQARYALGLARERVSAWNLAWRSRGHWAWWPPPILQGQARPSMFRTCKRPEPRSAYKLRSPTRRW